MNTPPPTPLDTPRPTIKPANSQQFHEAKRHLVESFECDYIVRKLREHRWNISAVSRDAGISRKHVRTLIRKYNLAPPALLHHAS